MKLGLIGNPLGHSWSPEIHKFLINADYSLWPLEESELEGFFARRDFDGINVTIPYKSTVIGFLDETDPAAERIQAVNCVTNRNGILKGWNTDVTGLKRLIDRHQVSCGSGMAAVLGTGGASKAACEACRMSGWDHIVVSRSGKNGAVSYSDLYGSQEEITVLINATPAGMHPDVDAVPVDIDRFTNLRYVIDIVANPVRTRLVYEAQLKGIDAYGGLEMLVAQAAAADELFTGDPVDDILVDKCVDMLLGQRRNIVLIGMPSSGKTTLGRMLARRLGRSFIDLDEEIVDIIGMPIRDYFAENGETAFRDIESEVCAKAGELSGMVISTGGGVVKRQENMTRLAHGGLILWIDRDPEFLTPTASRPLSSDREALCRLYNERKPLYGSYSDARIPNNGTVKEALERAMEYCKYLPEL